MRIRFIVIVGGILLAAATSTSAQTIVGLAGGGTYSDFSHPDTKSRWGFSGGLFAGKAYNGSLTLLEVSYTQKGGEGARIDYVETGITVGGYAKSGSGRARAYGGITVAFPVTCDATTAPRLGFCDNTNTEWGIPLGIMLGKGKSTGGFMGFDVRYTAAITDASLGGYNNTWMVRLVLGTPKGM